MLWDFYQSHVLLNKSTVIHNYLFMFWDMPVFLFSHHPMTFWGPTHRASLSRARVVATLRTPKIENSSLIWEDSLQHLSFIEKREDIK
mmetsp:Transcript_6633/g.13934  ORF Transcript_6633/g.13934 Transcript_6633/m.13934 type:complete len:88 (+) Transcript_6633:810-1073(+)